MFQGLRYLRVLNESAVQAAKLRQDREAELQLLTVSEIKGLLRKRRMPVGMGKRKSELIQKLLVCTLLVTYNGFLVHSATVCMGRPFWSSTNVPKHQSLWLLKLATLLISNIQ